MTSWICPRETGKTAISSPATIAPGKETSFEASR